MGNKDVERGEAKGCKGCAGCMYTTESSSTCSFYTPPVPAS